MKKFNLLIATIALAFANANATEITVTHAQAGKFANELTAVIGDYTTNKTVVQGITKLTVLSADEDNKAEMTSDDYRALRVAFGKSNEANSQLQILDLTKAGTGSAHALPSGTYSDRFSGCMNQMATLVEVYLPEDLEILSYAAFVNCTNLKTVHFPETLRIIREIAFKNAPNVEITELPDAVEQINNEAFYDGTDKHYCTKVALTKLPKNLKIIGKLAFAYTTCCFSKLPEGLEYIGQEAFRNTNIAIADMPENLKFRSSNFLGEPGEDVAPGSFLLCNNITEMNIPASWTSMPERTFYLGDAVARDIYFAGDVLPTAKDDDGSFYGTFGQKACVNACTLHVRASVRNNIVTSAPWSKMVLSDQCVSVLNIEAGEDGTIEHPKFLINGNGDIVLLENTVQNFTITTKPGYELDSAELNGENIANNAIVLAEESESKTYQLPVSISGENNNLVVSFKAVSNTSNVSIEVSDVDAAPVFYNLQGVRVENPSNGIFIMRQGNKVSKIVR